MTTAVLLATRPGPAGHLHRLIAQLAAGGAQRIVVLARPERAEVAPERAAEGAQSLAVVASPDAASDLAELATLCGAAAAAGTPLVLLDADLVAHATVISSALAGPGGGITAVTSEFIGGLASSDRSGDRSLVRVDRGRVISAGSPLHEVTNPTGTFAGLIRLSAAYGQDAAEALAAAAEVLSIPAGTTTGPADAPLAASVPGCDSLALALVALVRAGLPVRARETGPLLCEPVAGAQALARTPALLAGVDEDAARMRLAVKSDDDLFATYAVSSWSPHLVRLGARLGLSPTTVTWLSVALALFAATSFAQGGRAAAVVGALLLYLSFVLDCVDGQLARYTHQFSRFGGWLDALADRGKEYAVYAGLAVGAPHAGTGEVWALAIAAMTLQTVRHMTDCWYGVARDQAVARLAPGRFDLATDPSQAGTHPGAASTGMAGVVATLVQATNTGRRSVLHWAKKSVAFPIGERWLVIAAGAAIVNARFVFVALLTLGGLSALFTIGVRTLRTRSLRASALSTVDVALHRDDGLLARALGQLARLAGARVPPLPSAVLAAVAAVGLLVVAAAATTAGIGALWVLWSAVAAGCLVIAALAGRQAHDGAMDWYVPAALRLAESSVIIGLAVWHGVALPWLFALLGVLALLHYDLAARLDKSASPVLARGFALGWDGRLLVLAMASASGLATLGFAALTAYLAGAFVVAATLGAHRTRRSAAPTAARPPRQRSAGDAMAGSSPGP